MTRVCRACDRDTGEPIAVALDHGVSGAGRVVYLCPACREALRLVPLDQHPEGSLGYPVYEAASTP